MPGHQIVGYEPAAACNKALRDLVRPDSHATDVEGAAAKYGRGPRRRAAAQSVDVTQPELRSKCCM